MIFLTRVFFSRRFIGFSLCLFIRNNDSILIFHNTLYTIISKTFYELYFTQSVLRFSKYLRNMQRITVKKSEHWKIIIVEISNCHGFLFIFIRNWYYKLRLIVKNKKIYKNATFGSCFNLIFLLPMTYAYKVNNILFWPNFRNLNKR